MLSHPLRMDDFRVSRVSERKEVPQGSNASQCFRHARAEQPHPPVPSCSARRSAVRLDGLGTQAVSVLCLPEMAEQKSPPDWMDVKPDGG